MKRSFCCLLLLALCVLSWVSPLQAEDFNSLKRAKLTEAQSVNQLKYMMVKGFDRIKKEVVKNGSFPPFGLTLSPDAEFKAVIPDIEAKLPSQVVLVKLAESMAAIAQTRSMWAVGIMYIRAIKRDDGTYLQRIIVMTEHIAGWARHWAYPFKMEDGEFKLGTPQELEVKPVYFTKK
ncbi:MULTISPECIES: hypothetical protein [unclassified Oleiphilus]|uniref:hypothetical protein n=2 Tax=Oleiphilus TaxID=141450 RepID=UPI0007C3CC96|nr:MULTISPECIES: hypothetical protein [unclassified Oleiphilus]KZY42385.1 hypothetical protein A3732_16380 [Oleiphilus sp. HI0050]KZZ36152.1 hypothetical protein A3756_13705 [Oleiphilus sp. HI0086]KZZ38444.1 hypothetical protein A3757_07955 [Oleiphilus sp. HI0117]